MGMVSEDRIVLLDYLWDREDPDDPESMEWRDDLDAEELAASENPRTLPPRFSIAASKLSLVLVLGS